MENKKLPTNKGNKRVFVLSIIGLSLISIAVLFSLIGFFGSTATTYSSVEIVGQQSINPLDWFFRDGWEQVMQQEMGNTNVNAIVKMGFIFHFVSYICVIAGFVWSAILMSEGWVFFSKKNSAQGKLKLAAKVLILFSVPYIVLTAMFMFTSSTGWYEGVQQKVAINFGWGAILVIVAVAFSLAAMSVSKYCNTRKLIVRDVVLDNIPVLLMLFVMIFGFGLIFGARSYSEYSSSTAYANFWTTASSFSMIGYDTSLWTLYWFTFIFVFIIAILMMLSLSLNNGIVKSTIYCVSFVLAIIGGVLAQNAMQTYYALIGTETVQAKALFSSAFIVQIILFVISGGVTIANVACNKKQPQIAAK